LLTPKNVGFQEERQLVGENRQKQWS
jgi:hypothetical protein